ncbi:MAG TPA: sulfatase-like hydrolase/transferase [Opitutaceae bacterium]|jgi:arylsulfatase A-like enzyme
MPPNILLIVTTQWRAQAAGYRGDPNARTPFLDSLAAAGLDLAQAVTPHPFGPFARAAMLTGVESPANGVREYYDRLPPGTRTLAHRMAERGYATAFFGKWHLSARDRNAPLTGEAHARAVVPPESRGGFAFWEGFESGFLINDPWLHGSRLPEPVRFAGYQSDVVCTRALDYLANLAGPWCAVVSLEAPHPPYGATAAGVPARDPSSLALAANVPASAAARARRELAGYYAHLEATDRAIGVLANGLGGDTRLIVTSVHGDMHGAHGLFRKGWPHEESIRVPMLVRAPGLSGVDGRAFSLSGVPALVEALSEGRPLPPSAGHARISMPSVVALPDQCGRTWTGVRSARRKLVLGEGGIPWLFFDLEGDPLEQRNLAADPSRAGEMAALAPLVSPGRR